MATASKTTHISPEEFLHRERAARFKSEYVDGQIVAMSGATRSHNLIAGNLFSEINGQLRGRPCEAYMADMRVLVSQTISYTYPDIVVLCGEPQFLDNTLDTLLNPEVIIEVLSPSTEAYDRGRKFAEYRRIVSLREFVLVSQHRILVEKYARREGDWVLTTFDRPDDLLRFDSIGCEVPLSRIYDKVPLLDEIPRDDEVTG